MSIKPSFFGELKRRNVLRAGILYIGVIWALAQGAAQLLPVFDVPNWIVRTFVIAGIVGFPFWLLFAWFYELTPQGLKRESEIAADASITRNTGRKLDLAIISVLSAAVVLLVTDRFVAHRSDPGALEKSIAVMPLVNMSGDQSNEYFSDGVSEELINTLAKVRDLTVIGRNSSFQFKGKLDDTKTIAAKLGVAYLLEGSVRKASDRVRIAVNLVRASNSVDVWSETYDRDLKDVFAVQSDIATSVAGKLQTVLGKPGTSAQLKPEAPPSGNVDAYNAYLQGKFYAERNDQAGLEKAIEFFQTATHLDADYAEAWGRSAMMLIRLAANFSSREQSTPQYAQARLAIGTAMRLRPDLAVAHGAAAYLALVTEFDFRLAESEYRRAVQLDPQDADAKVDLASMLTTLGKIDEAIDVLQRALVTDPMSARVHAALATDLMARHRFDESQAALNKAIEIQPAAMHARVRALFLSIFRNDFASARDLAQFAAPDSPWGRFMRAVATQIAPDRAAADAALQTLVDHDADAMSYQIAEVYAIRGDADAMFDWLDRAWKQHDPGLTFLLFDQLPLRFKDDARYAAMVKKVGLPLENLATTQAIPYRGR
jgi:TolB-like protein/Flp pilus assembly protein TadD